MNTVSYSTYSKELHRLQREVSENTNRRIEVYEMNQFSDEPIQLGVNWSSIGTVTASEAEQFAKKLLEAAAAAEDFKYNGCIIDWEN